MRKSLQKLGLKIAKATFVTAIWGIFLFIIWFLISPILAVYAEYFVRLAVLFWALLFFTFTIKISEGTIYKYLLIMIRGFFFVAYLAYFTNYGVLTITMNEFTSTIEFVPLLALMIFTNLLAIARGLLQAIEFASHSPKD